MSLPPAAPQRQPKHRRQIDVQAFARGNGPALSGSGEAARLHYPHCFRAAAAGGSIE